MTECPDKLTTGCELMVSVDVFLLPGAFVYNELTGADKPSMFWGEGLETSEETSLRERKSAMLKMFDVLGLRPRSGASVGGGKSEEELQQEARTIYSQSQAKATKKIIETVGDGEEIEVEEGGELSRNDIDMIYKKCVRDIASIRYTI